MPNAGVQRVFFQSDAYVALWDWFVSRPPSFWNDVWQQVIKRSYASEDCKSCQHHLREVLQRAGPSDQRFIRETLTKELTDRILKENVRRWIHFAILAGMLSWQEIISAEQFDFWWEPIRAAGSPDQKGETQAVSRCFMRQGQRLPLPPQISSSPKRRGGH